MHFSDEGGAMKIEVTKQFLKGLYEIECVSDLKATLEKHFGEVVKPEADWPEGSMKFWRLPQSSPLKTWGKRKGWKCWLGTRKGDYNVLFDL